MKDRLTVITIFLLLMGSMISFIGEDTIAKDNITGRTERSSGLPTTGTCTTITSADVDEDGLYEIYIGGTGYQSVKTQGIKSFEFNPSTNTWSSFASGLPGTSSGKYYGKMSFGDIDEDGDLDLVAGIHDKWVGSSSNGVEIYTSNGASTFTLAHTINVGSGSSASIDEVVVADMDGDDNLDIVVAEASGVRVFFGSGSTTTWTESSPTAISSEIDGIGVGDLNGDGLLDVVGTIYTSAESKIFIQGTSNTWTTLTSWFASTGTKSAGFGCRIADLNGDGDGDVVYGTRSHGIRVWLGNGGGSTGGTSFTWTASTTGLPTSGGDYMQLEVDDINNDTKPDIVCSTRSGDKTRVFLNNLTTGWDEIFTGTGSLTYSSDGYGVALGDWDNDGQLDIAGGSWNNGAKAWIIASSPGDTPEEPTNHRPVPLAGDDIDQLEGTIVYLDGTNSTDADDDDLTYNWNFTKVPSGSTINDDSLVTNDTIAKPYFTPDMPGVYNVTLAVFDGEYWSNQTDEDHIEIMIRKINDPPVALCGPDQSGYKNTNYTLDGSDSYDIDGEVVGYNWTCISHTVTLIDPDSDSPHFTATEAATFVFTLKVKDDNDTWSREADTVNVTTVDPGVNVPPVADAGPDQNVRSGIPVIINGSGSNDPDGYLISYEWSCSSHILSFNGQNTSTAEFTPGEEGEYLIELRVEDSNHTWSSKDSMIVYVVDPYINIPPVADAGENLTGFTGDTFTLNGSGSSDLNETISDYNWTCISHEINLADKSTANPYFTPMSPGLYVFTLTVSDNEGTWSDPDEVTVNVTDRLIPTFDVDIGPFLYDDDTPVTEGEVRLIPDEGNIISSDLNSQGMASFTSMLEGTYTVELVQDGEIVIGTVEVTIDENGDVTYSGGSLPRLQKEVIDPVDDDDDDTNITDDDDDDTNITDDDDDDTNITDDDDVPIGEEDDGSNSILLILAVIMILLIVVIITVFIILARRNNDDDDDEGEETQDEVKRCPECQSEMIFRDDFEKYYCDECGRYR